MINNRYVPEDPNLPGLLELFPEAGAPDYIVDGVRQLTNVTVEPSAAEVEYVRYWPGRRCVVQWRFPNDAGDDVIISAELQPLKANKPRAVRDGHVLLEEHRLLLQAFPYDDTLPGIARAVSPEFMQGVLAPALGLSAEAAATLKATPTSYKSWRRCVVIYEAQSDGRTVRAYGKLFRDDRGAGLFESLTALDQQLAASGLDWGIASPILYDAEAQMLVQADIEDGTSLTDVAKLAPEDESRRDELFRTLEKAARGLPTFQRLDIPGLESTGPDELLDELYEDIESIAKVDEELASEIRARAKRTKSLIEGLSPEPLGLTHNAFRLSHIFHRRDGISLIDLDALAMGATSSDAGYFLAYLAVTTAERKRLRGVLTQASQSFTEALNEVAPTESRWLAFYAQMAILKWSVRAFYSLDVEWPERVSDFLKIGRRMISSLDKSHAVADPLFKIASSHRLLEALTREQVIPEMWANARYSDMSDVNTIYEPDKECLYVADFKVAHEDGETRDEKLILTFPAPKNSQELLTRPDAEKRRLLDSPFGEYLAEVYPADYKLPGLIRAYEPGFLSRMLVESGEITTGRPIDTSLLKYRPHDRAVLLLDGPDGDRYIAKAFYKLENAADVWHALSVVRPQLKDPSLVVRPIAIDEEALIVLMEFVEGENLGDMMDETTDTALMQSYVAVAARVLSQIHASDFESDDVKTHASELKRLRRTAGLLTEMAPDFARDVLVTLDRAEAAAQKVGTAHELSMVHGGFKPTQMLVKGDRATLVDFDGAAVGDPAIDVGRFMAKLRQDGLERNRRHLSSLPEDFLASYAEMSPWDVAQRAPLFELNALVRMSMRRFQTRPELLLDDDSSIAWNLLRLAQNCLERV